MCSGLIDHLGAIAGRMACILAVALLACASSAHGQVIEEGGFPVKGGGVSGETFSLSCPPRLYVEAGESVLFSCSATAVPEEGVRYEWESLSGGDGLLLLSDTQVLAPLFTAPLSGSAPVYRYRLTATGGVFRETATVEVIVEGFSGGGTGEGSADCAFVEGLRAECVPRGEELYPFVPLEEEGVPGFASPEAPGASGYAAPGEEALRAPPLLECPVAVFLEELETGAIECHAWDASGEEYLEYSWEPVGNTTRDYLDNPRLIPEDSPTPSVIAPEAPVYETLESFRSGETTFRYRYRLTAMSRATGLSSSSEVEVFVSSSRPVVYCPLEVVVEEGETVTLDCEGADPLSARMDYDDEEASIWWEWEGLWGTSTAPLAATDLPSPLFTAPAGSAGEEYHYIASMTLSASGGPRTARKRVTVRVVEGNAESHNAERVSRGDPLADLEVTCRNRLWFEPNGGYYTYGVMEGSANITLDCEASGGPDGASYTYSWTADSSTPYINLLSATNIQNPVFQVPVDVPVPPNPLLSNDSQRFLYYLDVSASAGGETATERTTVRVSVVDSRSYTTGFRSGYEVTEGDSDFKFEGVRLSRDPNTHDHSTYSWTGTDADNRLSDTDVFKPMFIVPGNVDADTDYEYTVLITNPLVDPDEYRISGPTVTVRNIPEMQVACTSPAPVYEGAPSFPLACRVQNAPSGVSYSWSSPGSPADTSLLSATDIHSPTFEVPENVDADTDYVYLLTASADGEDDATATVTVTVLNRALAIACTDASPEVYEGSDDITLACSASGAAPGVSYAYAWSSPGAPADTSLLSATNIASPTFDVPPDVNANTDYVYLLTTTAENATAATETVTVTVLNRIDLSVQCMDYSFEVHEGDPDFRPDCLVWNAPEGTRYVWTPRGDTQDTALLSDPNVRRPLFRVPGDVPQDTTYEYTVTGSAPEAIYNDGTAEVSVRVLDKSVLSVACTNADTEVYEGAADFKFDCTPSGAPSGSSYTYAWTGDAAALALLDPDDIASPTFAVPLAVSSNKTYEYTLTVSASGAHDATVDVEVTVLNKSALSVACTNADQEVYEGAEDFSFGCTPSGLPGDNPEYTYAWTGETAALALLDADDIASPTFAVPDTASSDKTYEYMLTVSAENADDATTEVTVTVLNKKALSITCTNADTEVYEGAADITFGCTPSGAPSGSSYTYAWTGDAAALALLDADDIASPTFAVPDTASSDKTYEYTLTVSAENSEDATAEVTVTVLNKKPLFVFCAVPASVFEGSEDITFNCDASGAPSGSSYTYAWTGDAAALTLLDANDIASPTFYVPDSIPADTTYEYALTVSAENADTHSIGVTLKVLNAGELALACTIPLSVYEGAGDVLFDCGGSGAPGEDPQYTYAWTGDAAALALLDVADIASPTFAVPQEVTSDETYAYTLTISAGNADDARLDVAITVLNKRALAVACTNADTEVYEGAENITLDCSASGAPGDNPTYTYAWTASGDAPQGAAALLSATDIASPTFYVPGEVTATTTYEYVLTVSAENAEDTTLDVAITVLNKGALTVVCTAPDSVYEGSENVPLGCEASGAPGANPVYTYAWTGDAVALALLDANDIASPTFSVPVEVTSDETYEYTLTVSAQNAGDVRLDVAITVLNKTALAVVCTNAFAEVYEGAEDFELDCEASGAPGNNPEYTYAWTGRGSTLDVSLLSAADIRAPLFHVPDQVSSNETYEYTLTVSAENAEDTVAEVAVTVLNKETLLVFCAVPASVFEGSGEVFFDCSASGAPGINSDYTYAWTGDAEALALLDANDIASPTFFVPDAVDEDRTYEYTLTASTENADTGSLDITVKVLNAGALSIACSIPLSVFEGSGDVLFDCSASGAPGANPIYTYAWTADAATLALLNANDIASPTFSSPDDVSGDERYAYTLTVSAENVEDARLDVAITVVNKRALAVGCANPGTVYEGSDDILFDCEASGAPEDHAGLGAYTHAWTPRGSTPDVSLLSAADIASPLFYVPEDVDATTTYEYLLTASANNAEDNAAEVSVTVLNERALVLVCAPPPSVYEGSDDVDLDCSASGGPEGSVYEYVWRARGSTPDVSLLSAANIASPTFYVPDEADEDEIYEYRLTVSAQNAKDAATEVTVTVLNKSALALTCADPPSVYESSEDIAFDCEASGAPEGSTYEYSWTPRGSTQDTALLSAAGIASPTFYVPDEVDATTTYEYRLTVSAQNADNASAEVAVTVLNKSTLALTCADPPSVYEGSEDITFDCSASGAPGDNPQYAYAWTARGDTQDVSLLSAADIESPTFYVPDEVIVTTTYEYLLTVSAQNADDGSAEVTVRVLDKPLLAVVCAGPYSLYEGSEDFAFDCEASGAPGDNPQYTYVWTARGDTQDTSLLSATDVATPTFLVPDDLPATTTYEYLLTASAANAEDDSAGVSVTVMHPAPLAFVDDALAGRVFVFTVDERIEDILLPQATGGFPPYAYTLSPALPPGLAFDDQARTISGTPSEVRPRREYAWQVTDANTGSVSLAFFIEVAPPPPPLAESLSPDPEALTLSGITTSVSPLRFGVQAADTEASLDPMTDGISTYVSGPYHAGRMTLSPGGDEALDENGEMELSIELASPVVLWREGGVEAASIVLAPTWSYAESCEQLSSQAIGGLYTETTLSEGACRLLRFGGELDLAGALPGRYEGAMDVILRQGDIEETRTLEVDVTVISTRRVITIGPGGVRFDTSREMPASLTENQNLGIYPDIAFLTEEKPHEVFELSNPSLIPLEISVSARFGYTEATENGREVMVENAANSDLGDLSSVVDIHPSVLVLQPGEKGLVRYGIREEVLSLLTEKGYAAFFDIVSSPRQYVDQDRLPEEIAGDRTARVTMRIPGVYVPEGGASRLRAELLSITEGISLSATFLVEALDGPFMGEVIAHDGEGRELGRRETLVYTRSRVRVPLSRKPDEETVFLRFAPRGPGRIPEPTSIRWNAPNRDIGEANDKDGTRAPVTLVQKP